MGTSLQGGGEIVILVILPTALTLGNSLGISCSSVKRCNGDGDGGDDADVDNDDAGAYSYGAVGRIKSIHIYSSYHHTKNIIHATYVSLSAIHKGRGPLLQGSFCT